MIYLIKLYFSPVICVHVLVLMNEGVHMSCVHGEVRGTLPGNGPLLPPWRSKPLHHAWQQVLPPTGLPHQSQKYLYAHIFFIYFKNINYLYIYIYVYFMCLYLHVYIYRYNYFKETFLSLELRTVFNFFCRAWGGERWTKSKGKTEFMMVILHFSLGVKHYELTMWILTSKYTFWFVPCSCKILKRIVIADFFKKFKKLIWSKRRYKKANIFYEGWKLTEDFKWDNFKK